MVTDKVLFIVDDNQQFLFDGKKFSDAPKKTKDYFSGAVIPSSFIKTYGMKLSKSIPSEKMEMDIEMAMYEDSGLNPEVEYKIASSIIELDGDDNYVEAYACEVSELEMQFSKVVKKNSHIDAIFPAHLSYSALYAYEKIPKANDLFIHISEKNSYAVIFKDGKYISTNSIPSLNDLAKKIGVKQTDILEHLTKKGVKAELYTKKESSVSNSSDSDDSYSEDILLMNDDESNSVLSTLDPVERELYERTVEELSKIVERVARTISHKRGVFKLESIDNIYFDMQTEEIPGFLEFFDAYGYENSKKTILDVCPDVEKEKKRFALYALFILANAQGLCNTTANLTIFERKPSFFKTEVGVFSLVLVLSLILSVAYPVYGYLTLDKLTQQEEELSIDLKKMQRVTKTLHAKLKKERKKRDELKKKRDKIVETLKTYDAMVDTLLSLKEDTLKHQNIIHDIDTTLKKYTLYSKHLEINGSKSAVIQIVTKYDRRDDIAKFMKELLHLGYKKVQTNKIEKNETYYESFVEIQP